MLDDGDVHPGGQGQGPGAVAQDTSSRQSSEAARRLAEALSPWTIDALKEAKAAGTPIDGVHGLLNQMTKAVLGRALQAEMVMTPATRSGRGTGNSRNGKTVKTVSTRNGPIEIGVPRDRNESFEPAIVRLLTGLDAGDTPDEQLARTWVAAQDPRLIYTAPDRDRAAAALYRWLIHCANADIPELARLARTIDSWRTEFLACFDTDRVSNGPTEAVNLLTKKIKRAGHGFRNFNNYRLRLLLHSGVTWDTIPATPIRGRLPRPTA